MAAEVYNLGRVTDMSRPKIARRLFWRYILYAILNIYISFKVQALITHITILIICILKKKKSFTFFKVISSKSVYW